MAEKPEQKVQRSDRIILHSGECLTFKDLSLVTAEHDGKPTREGMAGKSLKEVLGNEQ